MNVIFKDLLRLCIIIVVLCAMVFFIDTPGFSGKSDILFGVVGGGITAFLVLFVVKKWKNSKNK